MRVRGHAQLLVVAFVVHDVDELRHLQRWLRRHARAVVGRDEAGVLLLVLRVLDVEHRAGDEGLGVFVVDDAQQVVGAQDAFRRDLDVVVHQQHMRRRRRLLKRLDHAAREAAGAADVLVRRDRHMRVAQRGRVERAAVVDDMHRQMLGDVVVGAEQLGLHELDVAFDELFLAERRRRDRQFDVARIAVELDLVPAVADRRLRLRGDLESGDDGRRVDRDVERHLMPFVVAGHTRRDRFDELRLHRQSFGARLRHRDRLRAPDVDVQTERRRARVLEQLEHRQRIEIRREIDGAGARDRPVAAARVRRQQLVGVVIHRGIAQRTRLRLQQHVRESNR